MLGEWMLREIEEQPTLLARLVPQYETALKPILGGRPFEMVLLAARGSSDNAALYARYLIEIHLGIPAVLAAPSVLTRYRRHVKYPHCLAIGISQSGSAPDVSEVIADMREQGHTTLAITNTPDSRLDKEAEHTLILDAGPERSVAATKTFTTSLLALYTTVKCLGGNLPAPAFPDDAWLDSVCQSALLDAPQLLQADPTFALGRGFSFSTAQETALKLMECALVPCRAYSTADFEHGPKALADADSAIILFGEASQELRAQGARLITAPACDDIPEETRPIWQILYSQWLALHCARLKGEDPDKPQFLRKVTKTL